VIDALFETMGNIKAGHIELAEMTQTLQELETAAREATHKLAESEVQCKEEKKLLLQRAHLSSEIVLTSEEAEKEENRLLSLKNDQTTEAQFGRLLAKAKLEELIKSWDQSGSGEIQRAEFRLGVRKMGWQADLADVDKTFEKIDTDGSGGITLDEMRPALDDLRAAAAASAAVIVKCEKTVQHLQKRTKLARELLKLLTKSDKGESGEKKDGGKKDAGKKDAAKKKDGKK